MQIPWRVQTLKTKNMKAFKKDQKTGFIVEINTEGSYLPKGWSKTAQAASKRRK